MFDGLYDIDWSSLTHAYGPATDIPDDLRALVSADAQTAKDALWRLFGNIHHQGTVYTATIPAIPFLTEAALALPPERAEGIVDLFSAMIEIAAHRMIEDQLTVAAFRETVRTEGAALSPEDLADCIKFGCPPGVVMDTYDVVMAQIPVLLDGLDTTHPAIQVGLFALLADAPETSETAKTLAESVLFDSKADEVVQVSAIECLMQLGTFAEVSDFGSILERISIQDASPFLTAYVVLARNRVGQADVNDLLRVLDDAEHLYELDRKQERGKGWTASRIAGALVPFAENHKERICDALIATISAARVVSASPDSVVGCMVEVLAHPAPAKGYFSNKRRHDLTELEKRVLIHIAEHGTWKIGESWFGNFRSQMKSYGLPDTPDALQSYATTGPGFWARWFAQR